MNSNTAIFRNKTQVPIDLNGFADTVPPSDLEAEKSILGAVMLDASVIDLVQPIIYTAAVFYGERNRIIWNTMLSLHGKGTGIDSTTLCDELGRRGQLAEAGGVTYLIDLMEAVPRMDHAEYHAKIVRDKYDLRKILASGAERMRKALVPGAKAAEILDSEVPVSIDLPIVVTPEINQWKPFPVDALPEPLRSFVREAAKAIGCDPCYVAIPALVICGSACGNKVRLMLRDGWLALAILWAVIIGESGSSKSPALKVAMAPLRARQKASLAAHQLEIEEHKLVLRIYEKNLSLWKKENTGDSPPREPTEPQSKRLYVSDITVEAMVPLLQFNSNGLLAVFDEGSTWFGAHGKYSGDKGGDAAQWLSMYDAGPVIVDRKGGLSKTISVDEAAVSVLMGTQPAIFRKCIGSEHRDGGTVARLMTCTPPRVKRVWTEAIIDPETERDYARCINALHDIRFDNDLEGAGPHVFRMDREAKESFVAFFNEHSIEQQTLSGDLLAAWSKLAEIPGRLALILHMVRLASGDRTIEDRDEVDADSMYSALALTRWFKNEARRTYGVLSETETDRDQRLLVEWIGRQGGAVTGSELMKGPRQYRGSTVDADAALTALVKAGFGHWEPITTTAKGGRSSRRFVLAVAVEP